MDCVQISGINSPSHLILQGFSLFQSDDPNYPLLYMELDATQIQKCLTLIFFVFKLSEMIFYTKVKLGAVAKPWSGGVGMIFQSLQYTLYRHCTL